MFGTIQATETGWFNGTGGSHGAEGRQQGRAGDEAHHQIQCFYGFIWVEHQSTWSANIIVRMLMYLAHTYNGYFKAHGTDLYSNARAEEL